MDDSSEEYLPFCWSVEADTDFKNSEAAAQRDIIKQENEHSSEHRKHQRAESPSPDSQKRQRTSTRLSSTPHAPIEGPAAFEVQFMTSDKHDEETECQGGLCERLRGLTRTWRGDPCWIPNIEENWEHFFTEKPTEELIEKYKQINKDYENEIKSLSVDEARDIPFTEISPATQQLPHRNDNDILIKLGHVIRESLEVKEHVRGVRGVRPLPPPPCPPLSPKECSALRTALEDAPPTLLALALEMVLTHTPQLKKMQKKGYTMEVDLASLSPRTLRVLETTLRRRRDPKRQRSVRQRQREVSSDSYEE